MTVARTWRPRYYEIGFNLNDPMFHGNYNGSAKHASDIDDVIARAHLFNVNHLLLTASTIKESLLYSQWCRDHPQGFASTVGVHPCSAAREFYQKGCDSLLPEADSIFDQLRQVAIDGLSDGSVHAFGEIGLDYDRLHFASESQQLYVFERQLQIYASLGENRPPLFLHMRSACDDFISTILPLLEDGSITRGNGVVHSFTGSEEELSRLLDLGFFIGINGCSLRTEENLKVAAQIPVSRLMIETDAPWCEIRMSHACAKYITPYPNQFYPEIPHLALVVPELPKATKKAPAAIKMDAFLPFPSVKSSNYVKHFEAVQKLQQLHSPDCVEQRFGPGAAPLIKSRNEPVFIGQVAQVMCTLNGLTDQNDIQEFIDTVYENTCKLFNTGDHGKE